MNTASIINALVERYNCKLLSSIEPAPSDIDLFVYNVDREQARDFIIECGYILASENASQFVFRRFEGAKLYIIDLISDFNLYAELVADLELSDVGNATLAGSESLIKSFKYLCYRKLDKLGYVESHRSILINFLNDDMNFKSVRPVIDPAVSAQALMNLIGPPFQSACFFSLRFYKNIISRFFLYYNILGTGCSLAFIGPDGSGKSFIISKLLDAGPTRVVYMGDWFFYFQGFYDRIMVIPSPYNRFIYLFYFVENLIRAIKVSFLKNIGRIVLIDRFPGTNRNAAQSGSLGFLNRIIFKIFPKPSLIVLLDAPPEVVYSRKQELSVNEIEVLQDRLKKIIWGKKHIIVDTRDVDHALNTILAKIYCK